MLISHFISAYIGRRLWVKLDEVHHADLYILMPKANQEYNYYALLHMNQFIDGRKAKKVMVLTSDEGVKKSLSLFTDENRVKAVDFTRNQALHLIKYYALYEFSTKLTIISLTEPYDTCGENLLGVKGVNKEDLLCFDIYRFSEVPQVAPPKYTGNDKGIIDFLNTYNK